jgi:hypothetical protein
MMAIWILLLALGTGVLGYVIGKGSDDSTIGERLLKMAGRGEISWREFNICIAAMDKVRLEAIPYAWKKK